MASLDMSLEDIIKNRRNSNRGRGQGRPQRGRGAGGSSRGGGRTFGAPRRNPLGVNARPSAYTIAKSIRRNKNLPWQNGLFEDGLQAAGLSVLETGTKLYISNLDVGVTNEDIRDLFSEMGELIRFAIHFDKNGRPNGSAEVVFARTSDAFQALKRYNNVQLDGKPMKIGISGANTQTPPASAHMKVVRATNGKKRTVVMSSGQPGRFRGGFASANRGFAQRGRGGSSNGRGRGRGGRGGGGRGRGRGRGGAQQRKKNVEKSADELDKELENYHAEAMQS